MEYLKEGSFLEELDGLNIAVRVRETLGKGANMMKLNYEKNGDYMIPMLQMDGQTAGTLTKYGLFL